MAEEKIPITRGIPDEEMLAAFDVPAVAINRFIISFTRSGVRLAFGEQAIPTQVARYRAAIILAHSEALALRDLLTDMLEPKEAAVAASNVAESGDSVGE